MNKNLKWFFILAGMFIIGGAGSLFINYIVFSKLVDNPRWSENKIVKALSNKVTVIQNTEKVIVKDNESLAVISNQAVNGVVFVEEVVLPLTSSRMPSSGTGVVMSSDGIIAIHRSVFKVFLTDNYQISFLDGTKKKAKKVYEDEYTGMIFLKVDIDNLTTIPFVDAIDIVGGKKLINVYRENNQVFYNLGILSGFDYNLQTNEPSCDYLQGAFRVDFNEKALKYGVGGPMIDFNGQMVGLLAKKDYVDKTENLKTDFFVISGEEIKNAFNNFLKNKENQNEISGKATLQMNCEYSKIFVESKNLELEGNKLYSLNSKNENNSLITSSYLRNGDIVFQVDEKKVNFENPLSKILTNYKKGDKAKFQIFRDGKIIDSDIVF